MRVPAYSNDPGWQRFLSGFFIGLIFGWLLFLSLFGIMHERHVQTIQEQQDQIDSLKETNRLYKEDIEEQNKENEKKLSVQEIKISFLNTEELKLRQLTVYELEKQVKKQLTDLRNKNIENVVATRELLIQAIEHKQYKVDERAFRLTVEHLYLYTTVEFHLKIHLQNE